MTGFNGSLLMTLLMIVVASGFVSVSYSLTEIVRALMLIKEAIERAAKEK